MRSTPECIMSQFPIIHRRSDPIPPPTILAYRTVESYLPVLYRSALYIPLHTFSSFPAPIITTILPLLTEMALERGTIIGILAGVVGVIIPLLLIWFGNCEFRIF